MSNGSSSSVTRTDYVGGFIYLNNVLSSVSLDDGRLVKNASGVFEGQYYLRDHLGNVRVVYGADSQGNAVELQEDHYYPYGMTMSGLSIVSSLANNHKYQGKEYQPEGFDTDGNSTLDTYLAWSDFDARFFDPQLGRWHVPDPANQYASPYVGMGNNPACGIDPDGKKWTRYHVTWKWYTKQPNGPDRFEGYTDGGWFWVEEPDDDDPPGGGTSGPSKGSGGNNGNSTGPRQSQGSDHVYKDLKEVVEEQAAAHETPEQKAAREKAEAEKAKLEAVKAKKEAELAAQQKAKEEAESLGWIGGVSFDFTFCTMGGGTYEIGAIWDGSSWWPQLYTSEGIAVGFELSMAIWLVALGSLQIIFLVQGLV